MKFARYLRDTQTPEWKKAYIDYRGLKKLISEIEKSREVAILVNSPISSETHQSLSEDTNQPQQDEVHPPPSTMLQSDGNSSQIAITTSRSTERHDNQVINASIDTIQTGPQSPESHLSFRVQHPSAVAEPGIDRRPTSRPRPTLSARHLYNGTLRNAKGGHVNRPISFASPPAFHDLLPLLTPIERSFFTSLDVELNKVERFYLDHEQEMDARGKILEEQLDELVEHRRLFYATYPSTSLSYPWASIVKAAKGRLPIGRSELWTRRSRAVEVGTEVVQRHSFSDGGEETRTVIGDSEWKRDRARSRSPPEGRASGSASHHHIGAAVAENHRALDPDDYRQAKKKLKKAVQEHYRVLELLTNYRILNLTGFRKALKKFEKVTKIPALQAYMHERVEPCTFASGQHLAAMTKRMEELFTARFEYGNRGKAMTNLRSISRPKSYHLSTFRSGLVLGLSLPALVSGLYQSFQEETRAAIPGWDTLLFVYSVFLIPVLFSVLVGLNMVVWSKSRINYVFIFELNLRTRLSSREYFEIPTFLLATLFYAFWLSFSRIGSAISPTTWPLVWLGLTAFIIADPLPIFFRPSRWWLLKRLGRLLISGVYGVEFTDFWMGDQFCSLIYTLSNLYLVACAYTIGFDRALQKCSATHHWVIPFVLAALPLWFRLVQSVKRYVDSRLITHLINGGKYASGIIAYLFYFIWRHNDRPSSLVLWCFCNTLYAIYAASWDNLMDWSILKPHAKHRFLRPELVYVNYIPLYYFAIISNILVRFIWIFYIPVRGPSIALRSFIGAMLEMLRRWQWNFYRLENEHLGNMDQYRVTREVPLPYSHDELMRESDKEEQSDEEQGSGPNGSKRARAHSPLRNQTGTNEIRPK